MIELDPKDTDAHGWLGSTLEDMLDLKGAAESFGKVIELDPKDGFPRKILECVLTAMDDLEGAAESFGKFFWHAKKKALDPKDGFAGSLRRGGEFRAMRAFMRSLFLELRSAYAGECVCVWAPSLLVVFISPSLLHG